MITFTCSAILFDLDGVLVDSTRSVERQWRIWAREQGIDGDKVMAVAHGVRTIEVIRAVAPHLDAEAEVRKLESREANDHDGVTTMPGAFELVRSVPDGHWGVPPEPPVPVELHPEPVQLPAPAQKSTQASPESPPVLF